MRVLLPARRPPSRLERLVGRRRARVLRRRLGFVALGTGVVLLKPRVRWVQAAVLVALVLTALVAVGVAG